MRAPRTTSQILRTQQQLFAATTRRAEAKASEALIVIDQRTQGLDVQELDSRLSQLDSRLDALEPDQ